MYIPALNRVDDRPALVAFMARYDFVSLVTTGPEGIVASHVPVLVRVDGERASVRGHVARANPHWKAFTGDAEALAIFQGPHGYVSPRWYTTAPAVPTWNYAAVHAYGRPRVLEDDGAKAALLADMVARYEGGRPDGWRIEDTPAEYQAGLRQAIVAFEMPVDRLEGKWKLGQNRSQEDRLATIRELRAGNRAEDLLLADFMAAHAGVDPEP